MSKNITHVMNHPRQESTEESTDEFYDAADSTPSVDGDEKSIIPSRRPPAEARSGGGGNTGGVTGSPSGFKLGLLRGGTQSSTPSPNAAAVSGGVHQGHVLHAAAEFHLPPPPSSNASSSNAASRGSSREGSPSKTKTTAAKSSLPAPPPSSVSLQQHQQHQQILPPQYHHSTTSTTSTSTIINSNTFIPPPPSLSSSSYSSSSATTRDPPTTMFGPPGTASFSSSNAAALLPTAASSPSHRKEVLQSARRRKKLESLRRRMGTEAGDDEGDEAEAAGGGPRGGGDSSSVSSPPDSESTSLASWANPIIQSNQLPIVNAMDSLSTKGAVLPERHSLVSMGGIIPLSQSEQLQGGLPISEVSVGGEHQIPAAATMSYFNPEEHEHEQQEQLQNVLLTGNSHHSSAAPRPPHHPIGGGRSHTLPTSSTSGAASNSMIGCGTGGCSAPGQSGTGDSSKSSSGHSYATVGSGVVGGTSSSGSGTFGSSDPSHQMPCLTPSSSRPDSKSSSLDRTSRTTTAPATGSGQNVSGVLWPHQDLAGGHARTSHFTTAAGNGNNRPCLSKDSSLSGTSESFILALEDPHAGGSGVVGGSSGRYREIQRKNSEAAELIEGLVAAADIENRRQVVTTCSNPSYPYDVNRSSSRERLSSESQSVSLERPRTLTLDSLRGISEDVNIGRVANGNQHPDVVASAVRSSSGSNLHPTSSSLAAGGGSAATWHQQNPVAPPRRSKNDEEANADKILPSSTTAPAAAAHRLIHQSGKLQSSHRPPPTAVAESNGGGGLQMTTDGGGGGQEHLKQKAEAAGGEGGNTRRPPGPHNLQQTSFSSATLRSTSQTKQQLKSTDNSHQTLHLSTNFSASLPQHPSATHRSNTYAGYSDKRVRSETPVRNLDTGEVYNLQQVAGGGNGGKSGTANTNMNTTVISGSTSDSLDRHLANLDPLALEVRRRMSMKNPPLPLQSQQYYGGSGNIFDITSTTSGPSGSAASGSGVGSGVGLLKDHRLSSIAAAAAAGGGGAGSLNKSPSHNKQQQPTTSHAYAESIASTIQSSGDSVSTGDAVSIASGTASNPRNNLRWASLRAKSVSKALRKKLGRGSSAVEASVRKVAGEVSSLMGAERMGLTGEVSTEEEEDYDEEDHIRSGGGGRGVGVGGVGVGGVGGAGVGGGNAVGGALGEAHLSQISKRTIRVRSRHSKKGPYDYEGINLIQEMSCEHSGPVWCLKFSPCGRLLASAGQDHIMRVWVLREAYDTFADIRRKYNNNADDSASANSQHRRQSNHQQPTTTYQERHGTEDFDGSGNQQQQQQQQQQQSTSSSSYANESQASANFQPDNSTTATNLRKGSAATGFDSWTAGENTSIPTDSASSTTAGEGPPFGGGMMNEDMCSPFMPTPFGSYRGHTADILDISWSKNYFLLSSSTDKSVRLWHISRNECLCVFQHIDMVTSVSFLPKDDKFFISGSFDGKLRVWNITEKKVVLWNEVEGCRLITALAFVMGDKYVVAGTFDGKCVFYTTEQLKYHATIDVKSTRGKNAKAHKLLVTSNDSRIRLYDLGNWSLICKYKGATNQGSQIAASFSPDGKHLVCGSEDKYIYLWRTSLDQMSLTVRKDRNGMWERIRAHTAVVLACTFAPKPELIFGQMERSQSKLRSAMNRIAAGGGFSGGGSSTTTNSPDPSIPSTPTTNNTNKQHQFSRSSGLGALTESYSNNPNNRPGGASSKKGQYAGSDVIVTSDMTGTIFVFTNKPKLIKAGSSSFFT